MWPSSHLGLTHYQGFQMLTARPGHIHGVPIVLRNHGLSHGPCSLRRLAKPTIWGSLRTLSFGSYFDQPLQEVCFQRWGWGEQNGTRFRREQKTYLHECIIVCVYHLHALNIYIKYTVSIYIWYYIILYIYTITHMYTSNYGHENEQIDYR